MIVVGVVVVVAAVVVVVVVALAASLVDVVSLLFSFRSPGSPLAVVVAAVVVDLFC